VVGAGPAGLGAAAVCARSGLRCVLFDEQQQPGGQIYRGITNSPFTRAAVLGADYWRGEALVRGALDSGIHYAPGATVWGLLRPEEVAVSIGGITRSKAGACRAS
jgi:flavin-dependent dehydrogenase